MPTRPNILLIFTDQQRHDTIGALGNRVIQTPAMDSLVNEGVAFTSAYTPAPVCVAARCSMLLGQWAHQTGCTSNDPMPQDRTSLMELLRDAGYQTRGTGKMHFVPDGRKLWGFDARDYSEECTTQDDFAASLRANGYDHIVDPQGVRSEYYYLPQPSQLPARLHNSTWVADRSLSFLQTRDQDRPFFLWSSFIKPHPPFESPVPWNRLYKPMEMPLPHLPAEYDELLTYWNREQNRYKWRDQGRDMNLLRTMRAAYYAAISFVDYNAGRLLAYLRQTGELDNTLVIWTADHGEMLGDYDCYGKRTMLDAAHCIPLLARYPAAFGQGQRCDRLASLVDIMPTCLELAGLPVPEQAVGESLAAIASGGSQREAIVSQFDTGPMGLYSLIRADYKYVYSAPDQREWLFDRRHRPEERSVAGAPGYQPVLQAMRQELIQWLRRDGHESPLDGERWKTLPPRTIPSDPDAGLLFQEGAKVENWFPEGYRPRVNP